MKLKKIKIENYKSLKKFSLDVGNVGESNLYTFIGSCESGKTNILEAISLLNHEASCDYKLCCEKSAYDLREPICIKMTLSITQAELTSKVENFEELLKREITLEDESSKEVILSYKVNISEEGREESILPVSKSNIFSWTKMAERIGLKMTKDNIDEMDFVEIFKNIVKDISTFIPKIFFWEYQDSYLPPSEGFNLTTFKENPEKFPFLRDLFLLSGISEDDLKRSVEDAISDFQRKRSLEQKLTACANNFFRNLWKGHDIQIRVEIDGELVHISIIDKEGDKRFKINERSKGFKKFISFLFDIAVKNKSGEIRNSIILVDEPENSLHPGATECFRDCLLELSLKNYIFIASHSIFIIDTNQLTRHKLLEKGKFHTTLKNNEPSKEDIYNILETSIFKIIKDKLVIFEGVSDRHIFDIYTSVVGLLDDIEVDFHHSGGDSKVIRDAKYLKPKLKTMCVFDFDKAGIDSKKIVIDNGYGDAVHLKDLINLDKDHYCLEDLLPIQIVTNAVRIKYKDRIKSINLTKNSPVLPQIKAMKAKAKIIDDANLEELKKQIVSLVRSDIRSRGKKDISEKYAHYHKFAKELSEKIKKL